MPSLWDRTLGAFGLQRKGAVRTRTAYVGAANRLMDWIFAGIASADQEVKGDFRTLRARARDLSRNNALASRYLRLAEENVVGPDGIVLQARIRNRTNDNLRENANAIIEAAWKEWAKPEHASVDGRLSWIDIQKMAVAGRARDGEALVRMVGGFDNRWGFSLQVIDPDQLDAEFNRPAGNGKAEVRMGVEVDGWGRPVAYHLLTAHPSDYTAADRKRIRVPASEIIHLYRPSRPGQTRGVTDFAAVLTDAKMLAAYQEAEIFAARTAAAKSILFEQDPEAVGDPNAEGADGTIPLEMDPSTSTLLPPGIKPHLIDPTHPNSAFPEFSKAIRRDIATGLSVSYMSLTGDLSEANYSSMREGKISERDHWRDEQKWLVQHLHERVYRAWVKNALMAGAFGELVSMDAARYHAVQWVPRGWAWVDPSRDMQAASIGIGMRLDSATRLAAEQGRDIAEVIEEIAREREIMAGYGLAPADDMTPNENKGTGDEDGSDNESETSNRPTAAAA